MRVLIFEPKFVGHFLGFAAVTAKAFAEFGCQVTMQLPLKAQESDQARIKLSELPENVDVRFAIDVPELYKKWSNAKLETDALSIALEEVPTDHLVIPSGDFILSGLLKNSALRRRLRSLGGVDIVLHNCRQVYPGLGIKQRCWCLLDRLAVSLARGFRLHAVDPFATVSPTNLRMSLFGNPVHPLPHFLEVPLDRPSQAEARSKLRLPATGKLLGSIGDLGRRKGTELLIESFAGSQPQPDNYLVLFGLVSSSVRRMLEEHRQLVERGQIICRDHFVSDDDFSDFFYAMDTIWAGFPNHVGISSTQLYAAEAGCPVIASTYGAVGWLTNKYGLGRTFPCTLEAMTTAISSFQQTDGWSPDPQGLRQLLAYHTTANFKKNITYGVRQRLPSYAGSGSAVLAKEEVL